MASWTDIIMVLLILINLVMLGTSQLTTCIRLLALQGIALGLLPLGTDDELSARLCFLVPATIGLKGIIFPKLLNRALREAEVRREVEPFIGYTFSVLIGLAALAVSFWLGMRMPVPLPAAASLVAPGALFMTFVGLILIISRKKALTQVLGFVVLENGAFAFGLVMLREIPLLVELGILLDAFVAVFVMGIAIYHINREFDHTDVDRLDTLKG